MLEQLKFGFKRTINWNKYQSKISTERPNQYLDYLIDRSFQGVNRLLCFAIWRWRTKKKLQAILSSVCWNKKLFYDLWTKLFWSTFSLKII